MIYLIFIQCLPHAWHLSVDFQLHTASFFLILLLFQEPAKGVLLALTITVGSIIFKAYRIYSYEQPAFITFEKEIQTVVGNIESVFGVSNNIPNYMIGLLLGHFMNRDLRIRPRFASLAWLYLLNSTNLMLGTTIVALALPFQLPPNIQSFIDSTPYLSFLSSVTENELPYSFKLWIGSTFHTAVSLNFALFCYLCFNESRNDGTGNLSLFNHVTRLLVMLLSCKFFTVLGRISLPMMISHYLVIEYMTSVMVNPFPVDFGEVLLRAPFVFFMSIFLGLIIHMTILSPFNNIISLITKQEKQQIVDVNNNVMKNSKKVE